MTYVRLTPVSAPSVVKGDITLPTTAGYDGVIYTVPMANVADYRNAAGWNRFSNYNGKY